jgi:hypothetical protein
MAFNTRYKDDASYMAAQQSWLDQRAAQGQTQRTDGTFAGTDGTSVRQPNPFSAYRDQDGNMVREFNSFTAKNGVQGTQAEPGRSFLDYTNKQAMDNFNAQTDKLQAINKEGQDRIMQMFNTSLLGQASMAYGFMKS